MTTNTAADARDIVQSILLAWDRRREDLNVRPDAKAAFIAVQAGKLLAFAAAEQQRIPLSDPTLSKNETVADAGEVRAKIAQAIHDPGATEGYKGERSLTEWQTDAVMRALVPIAPDGVESWQDISSAPKDGTFMLLASNVGHVACGFWNGALEGWQTEWGTFHSETTVAGKPCQITHRQPMPPPPALSSIHGETGK